MNEPHHDDTSLEVEIDIAKSRLMAMDWGYLLSSDKQRGMTALAYAMLEVLVMSGGPPQDDAWHQFLDEALQEVIMKAQAGELFLPESKFPA